MNKFLVNYYGRNSQLIKSINLTYPNYFDIIANMDKGTKEIEVLKPREIRFRYGFDVVEP